MSNSKEVAVVQSGGFLATSADFMNALDSFAGDLGSGASNFLRFDGNTGEFTYGANKEELPPGTQLAVNLLSVERGFICWKDEEVVDEVMVSLASGAPKVQKTQLTDHGPYETDDGWQEQVIIDFKMVDSPGLDLRFKATGVTKINAVGRLLKNAVAGAKANMGLVPIVEISETEYESKAKGARGAKKHAPEFKIIDWASPEQLEEIANGIEGEAGEYQGEEANEAAAPAPTPAPAPAAKAAPARPAAPKAAPAAAPKAAPAPAAPVGQAPPRRGRFG